LNILLIDDEQDICRSLSDFIQKLGHQVTCASNAADGLRAYHAHEFDLIITDIRMPEMDGLEFLRRVKTTERSPADVIVITGHGDMDSAIRALKYGAYDYLQKPINVRELAIVIERSAEYRALRNKYTELEEKFDERIANKTDAFRREANHLWKVYLEELGLGDMGVYSEAMRQVMDLAARYGSDRSIPVLIEGETGTGKELVARFIHYYGKGDTLTPFLAINCGGVPSELFESELFGHEAGAFTGATAKGRTGKFEMANGGTIFLDEVGELPSNLQVKLLRIIEEKKLYRVGGIKEIPLDLRVISATNKNLSQEVANKRFRLDLFYRINMGAIRIPPLRERREDILPLALRFVNRALARSGKKFNGFTRDAEEFLDSHPWPGNVRQLKNAMERLALLGPWDRTDRHDLSFINDSLTVDSDVARTKPILGHDAFELPPKTLDLEDLNRRILKQALEKNHGNQTKTAQYLGISRRILEGKLKKMGLS
jgi:DNA-binding NtrC family response regulator